MQRGFSLIEVIFFCFGISILAAVILPRGLNFFQRTTMFFETQHLHTDLRIAQDLNSTTIVNNETLDFPSIVNKSGEVRFKLLSNARGYYLSEKNSATQKILQQRFPSWLKLNMNSDSQAYFSKYGTLQSKSATITVSRNGSMKAGEKYTVILHTNGRIRADFKNPSGN